MVAWRQCFVKWDYFGIFLLLKVIKSYKINEKHTFNAGVRTDFSWLTPESRIGNEKNALMYNEEYDLAENLYAAYVNYKYKKCAWSWMIGLRGEYSDFSAMLNFSF